MVSSPATPPENPPLDSSHPQTTRPFRFKPEKRLRSHSTKDNQPRKRRSLSPCTSDHTFPHHHRRHHHHHRSRRRPHTPPSEPLEPAAAYHKNATWESSLNPDAAFRESLFDALADDEGAAFWEGVYGQPIHTYSDYYPATSSLDDPDNPKLEKMSDEEYVAYVRAKMWEKSHEYILEERRKRDEDRAKRKEREREQKEWRLDVEEALRRGEERRRKGRRKEAWGRYMAWWEMEKNINREGKREKKRGKESICWPVISGKWVDVVNEEVERFYRDAPKAASAGEVDWLEVLKKERVKWHPDKMQQRAGSKGLDEETMKLVTAVFQVVDRLWGETRGSA